MEWRGVTTENVFVANFFFVAAFGLVITAQWELSIGNGFAYTVFSAFGEFGSYSRYSEDLVLIIQVFSTLDSVQFWHLRSASRRHMVAPLLRNITMRLDSLWYYGRSLFSHSWLHHFPAIWRISWSFSLWILASLRLLRVTLPWRMVMLLLRWPWKSLVAFSASWLGWLGGILFSIWCCWSRLWIYLSVILRGSLERRRGSKLSIQYSIAQISYEVYILFNLQSHGCYHGMTCQSYRLSL